MTLEDAKILAEPELWPLIDNVSQLDPSAWLLKQKSVSPELARAVAEVATCWKKAPHKFGDWHKTGMLYVKESFEQSSGKAASVFKAGLIETDSMTDACGGLGFDTLAFLKNGVRCFHNDPNPVVSFMAAHNHRLHGFDATYSQLDANDLLTDLPENRMFYLDPSRRDAGSKIYDAAAYSPNPVELVGKLPKNQPILLKLSPLFDVAEARRVFGQRFNYLVVSVEGENRELLCFRSSTTTGKIGAAVLHHQSEDFVFIDDNESTFEHEEHPLQPGKRIFIPDAALVHSRVHSAWAVENDLLLISKNPLLYSGITLVQGTKYVGELVAFCALNDKKVMEMLTTETISAIDFRFPERLFPHAKLRQKMKIPEGSGYALLVASTTKGPKFLLCKDVSETT